MLLKLQYQVLMIMYKELHDEVTYLCLNEEVSVSFECLYGQQAQVTENSGLVYGAGTEKTCTYIKNMPCH